MREPRLRAWRLARAARRAERQTAPSPVPGLPAIAEKADDLEEIKKSVEDAASVSGGLWLSYLFVLSYVAIAAGAVTHEDLLLERTVKLPFLNVELPLLAFFALAPFVILIIHAYALMHFIMLGRKASRFHDELQRQFPDSETTIQKTPAAPDGAHKEIRDKLRRLLPSNIFVQILAGPPELRTGIFGWMLNLIALTTLVVFPILLLLLLQIQFLPFHDVSITNAQRVALFFDIVLLWLLRPPIFTDLSVEIYGRMPVLARVPRSFGLATVMSILALWFSIVVATIPGEWQETVLASLNPPLRRVGHYTITPRDVFFAGEVDNTTRRRKSLFSNTLVLPGFNLYEALKIDDPKKLAWKEHLFDLRGRHLEHVVLHFADLTKADLTGAQLQGASLFFAKLQGATLDETQLQGASLVGAQLQGAALFKAQLQGAWLHQAQLQGAFLYQAQLQGALLDGAQLQGAVLDDAQLQGVTLDDAQLQGVFLDRAQLQGASLDRAQLQGASLHQAQLQGASLLGAAVNAADFSDAFLWRTNWGGIDPAKLGAVRIDGALERWKPVWQKINNFWQKANNSSLVPWSAKAYAELLISMNGIPEGKTRGVALMRIETLDCGNPDKTLASCDPAAKPPLGVLDWQKNLARVSGDDAAYRKALDTELRGLLCANDATAIHVLRGIIGRSRLAETGHEAPALVDFIMSKDCPVSTSLTDDDKAKLLKIKQAAEKNFPPPPASKKDK